MKDGIVNRYSFRFKAGDKVLLKPTPEQTAQGAGLQMLSIVASGWTIRSNDYAFVYVCKNEDGGIMTVPAINVDSQGSYATQQPSGASKLVELRPQNYNQVGIDGASSEGV